MSYNVNMPFVQFAANLFIAEDPSFGNYDKETTHDLLKSIDINFSKYLDLSPFSTCNCFIAYKADCPECCKISPHHVIFLTATQNHWAQLAYQFAHEYCHHLINGELSGDISGLMWFEESVCELSSMFHIHLLFLQWKKNKHPLKSRYVPFHLNYLNALLTKNRQLISLTNQPGWLQSWDSLLSEPQCHRNHYNAIAAKMYPLFVANPRLWRIILHFGDTRKWNSLSELFEHLHQTADDSYSQSLSDLEKLLLS